MPSIKNPDINKRMKELREARGYKQGAWADLIGVRQGTLCDIENIRSNPSEMLIRSACRIGKANYEWLVYGTGERDIQDDDAAATAIDEIMTGENSFAKSVFKAFAKLGPEEWKLLEKLIETIKEEQKK